MTTFAVLQGPGFVSKPRFVLVRPMAPPPMGEDRPLLNGGAPWVGLGHTSPDSPVLPATVVERALQTPVAPAALRLLDAVNAVLEEQGSARCNLAFWSCGACWCAQVH